VSRAGLRSTDESMDLFLRLFHGELAPLLPDAPSRTAFQQQL